MKAEYCVLGVWSETFINGATVKEAIRRKVLEQRLTYKSELKSLGPRSMKFLLRVKFTSN